MHASAASVAPNISDNNFRVVYCHRRFVFSLVLLIVLAVNVSGVVWHRGQTISAIGRPAVAQEL